MNVPVRERYIGIPNRIILWMAACSDGEVWAFTLGFEPDTALSKERQEIAARWLTIHIFLINVFDARSVRDGQ